LRLSGVPFSRRQGQAPMLGMVPRVDDRAEWKPSTALHRALASSLARNLAQWKTRRIELALLGLWIGFFFLVNAFVRALNTITVPILDMPLGIYMAIQGSLVVFIVLLFRFIKQQT
jgi:putative solute:sodium symporter small subunit